MVSTKLVDACQTLVCRTMLAAAATKRNVFSFADEAAEVMLRMNHFDLKTSGDATERPLRKPAAAVVHLNRGMIGVPNK